VDPHLVPALILMKILLKRFEQLCDKSVTGSADSVLRVFSFLNSYYLIKLGLL